MSRKNKKRIYTKHPALQHAIEVAGGAGALARSLGITVQAISAWEKCPPRRALAIERATGGVVSKERLCPEVFGEAAIGSR